jgi:hypothetical protein
MAVARITDRHWKRLPALIRLAFTTGIRRGSLLALYAAFALHEGTS